VHLPNLTDDIVYTACEKNGISHQSIVTDQKSGTKYVKARLQNIKIQDIKVFKNDSLTEFEICPKQKPENKPKDADPVEPQKPPQETTKKPIHNKPMRYFHHAPTHTYLLL